MGIRLRSAIVCSIVMFLLISCATTDDPSEGGLIDGIVNLGDDGYIKRQKAKEEEYKKAKATQHELMKKAEELRRERAAVNEKLNQADRRLTRETGGCGLGLSIVRFIVEAHDGSVHVDSRPGQGSTFTVKVPTEGGRAG